MIRRTVGLTALLTGLALCLLTWASLLLLSPITLPLMAACERAADWAEGVPRNV